MRVIDAYMGYIRAQLHMWALLPGLVPRFNLLARAQPSEGQQLRDELHYIYIAQYIEDGHNPWTGKIYINILYIFNRQLVKDLVKDFNTRRFILKSCLIIRI